MIDFEPEPVQRSRWESAREFAVHQIMPIAAAIDREGKFPWGLVEKGVRAGFTTMLIPTAYGGGGYDNVSAGLVLEELGAACAGVATVFGASILGVGPILLLGSDEQKQRLLRPIAEDSSGRFLCAFAVTESGSGSAAPSADPAFGVQMNARRDGESYVLSGSKRFVSNGSVAKLFSVLARTNRTESGVDALSFFAVGEAVGLEVSRVEDKMGQCACPAAELRLDQVRVPQCNLLGKEGLGLIGFSQTICFSAPLVAAICVGLASAALKTALKFAKDAALVANQGVAMRLFDMGTAVEAARQLVWRALWHNDQRFDRATGRLRGTPNLKLASMAKVFASDACVRVVDHAIQIVGLESVTAGHPLGKLVRDAKLMQIFDGANELHRISAARLL